LISHAADAVPGGKLLGLPYFMFRSKLVEYGESLARGLRDRLDGAGRYDRTQRLQAAHAVIVMTAFAQALGELLDGADLKVTRRSKALAQVAEEHGRLVLRFDDGSVPDPGAGCIDAVTTLYAELAVSTSELLRTWGVDADSGELRTLALRRYEELYRRLAAEAPEFGVWAYLSEHQATRAELRTGLSGIAELLAEVSGRAAANRVRAELSSAYQAVLTRSVLGETHAPDSVVLPTMERGYVNPAARVATIDSECRPSEDGWWDGQQSYDDIQTMIVGALTAPSAVESPLVILGQPGAGKSVLTRMLSARLADRGFLPVRVELRNVPADADVQTQIEQAIRDTIGRTIEWPDLADSARADGLLPLILLDGFDELLQATGVNRSDYLEQVARFQRREFVLDRPVAAIVTSRTVVADRARFPEGGLTLRIEPFDETRVTTWLDVWNAVNGTLLDATTMLRYGELAEQPLLLTFLALYDAGTGALRDADVGLSRAELYDQLLSEFARREVQKQGNWLDPEEEEGAVADELRRLELVALAMFNRHAKSVTRKQLEYDLADEQPAATDGMEKPLTVAQLTVGRFFFVHESSAQRAGEIEHAYEFLHATLGEFLVARYVVETLCALARDREYFRATGRTGQLDDGELWVALSFAALTGSAASVEFTEGLLRRLPDDERATVRKLVIVLLDGAQYPNPRRSRTEYEPEHEALFVRHACYSANLTVLAVLSTGEPLDFHPPDIKTWPGALKFDEFAGLRNTIRALVVPGRNENELRIVREDQRDVDPYESNLRPRLHDTVLAPSDRLFVDPPVPADSEAGRLIRESAFRVDSDLGLAALMPYADFIGGGISSGQADGGIFVPAARALIELRLTPVNSADHLHRCRVYEWCLDNRWPFGKPWLSTVLRQLREDAGELNPTSTVRLLKYALDRSLPDEDRGGMLGVLYALRDVDEARFLRLVASDDRVRELLEPTTDDTQK